LGRGIRLTRIRDFWDKFLHVSGCAGLYWFDSGRRAVSTWEYVFYAAAVFFLLIGGYAINDAADYPQDRRAGKGQGTFIPRRSHSLISSATALAAGVLLIAAASKRAFPVAITVGTILIGIEYSLPPARFKERGIWGIVVGALTQRPALFLVFAAMTPGLTPFGLALCGWLFFGGMAAMMGHQVLDIGYDRVSDVRTFVIRRGSRSALALAAACTFFTGLAVLSPLIFAGGGEAWMYTVILGTMSLTYVQKIFKALRKMLGSRGASVADTFLGKHSLSRRTVGSRKREWE
jgi:4-hydroxybenzoate polyprenyltransferase